MSDFIAYELQAHHGDLHLPTPYPMAEWPPLTDLGSALSPAHDEGVGPSSDALNLRGAIRERAGGNIALAKAHIESLQLIDRVESLFTSKDRIPSKVINFFRTVVEPVVQDPIGRAALMAFMEAHRNVRTLKDDPEGIEGGDDFERQDEIESEIISSIKPSLKDLMPDGFSIMGLLFAARGFLVICNDQEQAIQSLRAYNDDFWMFLTEGYCDRLK